MQQEREIDLLDLCKKLLRQWKWILIGGLIVAVIFAGVRWYGNLKEYNDAAAAAGEEGAEVSIEDLEDSDQAAVTQALNMAKQVSSQQDYLDNSFLMSIDPYSECYAAQEYYVSAIGTASDVVDAYITYVSNQGYVSYLSSKEAETYSLEDLSQAVTCQVINNASSSTVINTEVNEESFLVRVIGPDEDTAKAILEIVTSALEGEGQTTASQVAAHTLTSVASYSGVRVDDTLATTRNNLVVSLNTNRNSLNTLVSALSDNQSNVYKALLEQWQEEQTEGVDLAEYAEEESETASADADGADESADATETTTTITKPSVSKKDLVLGFLIGAILVCAYFALKYFFSKQIHTADDVEAYPSIKVLSVVKEPEKAAAEVELLAASLSVAVKKDEKNTLTLASSLKLSDSEKTFAENLKDRLAKEGLTCDLVESLPENAEGLHAAAESGNVLLLEKAEATEFASLDREQLLFNELGITCRGAVVFGE